MLVKSIFLIFIGFVLLIKGADYLVEGSSKIAKKFHIPEIIIGLTIVSIGTSMPELFVSTTSAIDGFSDMAMGNVIGSNLCNLLLILGLSSIIRPIEFQRETRIIELPLCLFLSIILLVLSNTGGKITREESLILICLFVCFIAYTIFMAKKGEAFDKTDNEEKSLTKVPEIPILKNIFSIIIGVIALKIGGDFTVDNAVIIAEYFKISEQIISLTILAVGTSLPELVTSVMAASKGNSDIAIGNIIGSNIFNMLLIIGVSALISPITYNFKYNLDMTILVVAMLILALFPLIPPKNKMSRVNGAIYLSLYVGYLGLMFIV